MLLRPLPGGGFTQFDEKYHVGDFIYIKANRRDGRHEIAQIVKVNPVESPARIMVSFLDRYDDFVRKTASHTAVFDEVSNTCM